MAREDKEKQVQELTEIFKRAKSVYLTDFKGLDVNRTTELRKKFREQAVEYRVVKNTLAQLAAKNAGYDMLLEYLTGPTGMAFGITDPIVPARILSEFAKDETKEVKVRYKDFGGQAPVWQSLPVKTEWPEDGRLHLGMETDDLRTGKIRLLVAGKEFEPPPLVLQKLSRLTAGIFVQAPPREAVQATVDNIVLVLRGAQTPEGGPSEGIKLIRDEDKKAPPPGDKKPEPEKKAEPDKKAG